MQPRPGTYDMPAGSSHRRPGTLIGKFANAIARLSAQYLRAIADQISSVGRHVFTIYRRFERYFVGAITDLVLFVWALRSFALLLGLQVALVLVAIRWPLAWFLAIGFAVLLVSAAVEVARNRPSADATSTDESAREIIFTVLSFLLRGVVMLTGLAVTVLIVRGHQVSLQQALANITSSISDRQSMPKLDNAKISSILEETWNYYAREEIFLGPNYVGNTTSFGRYQDAPGALALMSDYPTYQALAKRGLLGISSLNLSDAPSAIISSGAELELAANITLTPAGSRLSRFDIGRNTVTFVFGTYHVQTITSNETIQTSDGVYKLVEGTHAFALDPQFSDIWGEVHKPTYRDRRFRVIFKYNTTDAKWEIAAASDGRFSAEDTGPRDGDFESNEVPLTLEHLRGVS